MKRFQPAAVITVLVIAYFCSRDVSAQIMVPGASPDYYLSDLDKALWKFDVTAATATKIGTMINPETGNSNTMTDIAVAPSGQLYGITGKWFYSIDPKLDASGMVPVTNLGPLGSGVDSANSLAFSSDGTPYFATLRNGQVGTINIENGRARLLPELTGGNAAGDLAFSPDGTLYMSSCRLRWWGFSRVCDNRDNDLYVVNPVTGAGEKVGSIGHQGIYGMDFVGDTLFGFSEQGRFIYINKVTGVGTHIANISPTDADVNTVAVAGATALTRLPADPPVRQKVFLDWDSGLDREFIVRTVAAYCEDAGLDRVCREYRDFRDGTTPLIDATPDYRMAVLDHTKAIFAASGLDVVEFVDQPENDVVTVRFGRPLTIDDDGDPATPTRSVLGWAYNVLPTGGPGVDQFNHRPDGQVAILMDLQSDAYQKVAEVIVHEVGHALGLAHINPGGEPEPWVVMDRDWYPDEKVLPRFANTPQDRIVGRDTQGDKHNPAYHLRRYVGGETHKQLENEGLVAGEEWDLQGNEDQLSADVSAFGLAAAIYDVTVQADFGGDWQAIAHFNVIDAAEQSTFSFGLNKGVSLRIMGSTVPDGDLDVFFGLGDATAPDVTLEQLDTGELSGRIFRLVGEGGTLEASGTFTVVTSLVSDVTDLTGNGFVDADDLFVLLANWDTLGGPELGDLFDDPAKPGINADDLFVLLAAWTGPAPAASPEAALGAAVVPEPSALVLAIVSLLVVIGCGVRTQHGRWAAQRHCHS